MDSYHAYDYGHAPPLMPMHHAMYANSNPEAAAAGMLSSPTSNSSVFTSHPLLPTNMLPQGMTLQSLQQQHSQQQHAQHQHQQSMSPLFQSMHQLQQQQQQQQHSQLQHSHSQQQQPLHYQPEASTSGSAGMGGGYIGSPLVESNGPASPDESTSARDRRASKKGTKRPRPTLSCTECVRRKSKCDRVIPCSTCIKRGSPDKCRVDDEADRPSQPFAQARELEAIRDRVQKLEQLICMLAPLQARALGLDPNADRHDSENGSVPPLPLSASPTSLNFPSNAAVMGSALLGAGSGANLFMLLQGASSSNKQKKKSIKQQQQQGSDSELDEDEEGEDGREAEKAAFALESIAVAGRPSTLDTEIANLPMTSQARVMESQLRQREVDFLMSMLPDWNLSRSLVDAFFAKVAWQNHVIHIPTFEAQYTGMKELVDQHRISEIDPAWLSLYFMVLACGLFHSPNRPDMPGAHQAEYTHTWVIGAQRALQLADWSGKPSLTCIQSVVLLPIVLMHAGGIKRLASWIAAALRMAQLLDLHKLDDNNTATASSTAGQGGKNGGASALASGQNGRRVAAGSTLTPVEREIGKRLYFSLTHGEVNFASRWLGLGSNSDAHNHVIPALLNVDDSDLLANPPVPKPIEVATASSFQVIRARITMQDFNARLTGSDARAHKYETVLAFDQRTKELLDRLPAYFKYDRSDDPEIKAIVKQRPYIAYQRCVILYGLNNRLLRAHRPFMSRGYQDVKYAYSTESCIKAAKVIIAAQRALRDIFDAADRMYNCLLYCFSSAVVLLVDNFHRLAANSPISDTSDIDAQRHEALDVLHMLRRESNMSTIAASGAKVLEGLLNEEGQRRIQIGLPPAGEDFSRNTTPDTDHSSLREVVGRIASVSNHTKPIISPSADTLTPTAGVNALSDPQQNVFAAAPTPVEASEPPKASSTFTFSASAGQPSSTNMGGTMDPSLSMLPTQTFLGSALGNNMLGGDDSEDLLRSLGFFEVTGNSLSSVGQSGGSSDFNSNLFGGENAMSGDLGWLDGLGDW